MKHVRVKCLILNSLRHIVFAFQSILYRIFQTMRDHLYPFLHLHSCTGKDISFFSLTVIGIASDTSLASLAIAAKRFRLIPKLLEEELSVLSLRLRIGIDFRALS